MDPIWLVLTFMALLALIPNAVSLVQGFRLRGHVSRAMRMAFGAYLPRVVLILPVRGLDEGFDANVRSILSQSYPHFRVIAVADEIEDPALVRIREISREFPRIPMTSIVSQPSPVPGKVNALRSALARVEREDEVVAFADSDIRPPAAWLRQLVQPLADSTVGVATGFRWYVPPRTRFWSLVRAEWNAVSANVLFDPRRSFAWGGSCALRTDVLPRLRLEDRWRNVLSDDLVLTQAVREAGLKIAYAPAALVPTLESADRRTCIEWCFRQMTMATLYLPIVRRYAVAAFSVLIGSLVFAIVCIGLAAAWGATYLIPATLFAAPLPTSIVKSSLRRNALFSAAPTVVAAWRVPPWRTALAAMAVPWVMATGLLRTRKPSIVRWRGRTYDVRDPQDVRLRAGSAEGRSGW